MTKKPLFQAVKGKINKGGLHKSMNIPMGQKIPISKIDKAASSPRDTLKKEQAILALNMMGKKK